MDDFDATFNCNGKVNVNDWNLNSSGFFMKGDVELVLSNSKPNCNTNFRIFDFDTTGISFLLKLQHFSRCLESRLKQFARHEKLTSFHEKSNADITSNFYKLRKSVCEFVYHLRNYLKCLKAENFALKDISDSAESDFDDLLSTILKFLSRLKNLPASTFLYVSSPAGNNCNQPEYHVYHIHLDLRWLLTTLICIKSDQWDYSIEPSEDLKNIIHNIISDLIYISVKIFESTSSLELRKKTPYSCTCLRELFLNLQILTDELSKKNLSKNFWDCVNSVLNEFMENVPDKNKYKDLTKFKNPELFCTWFIYHLTLLYGYNEHGIFLNGPSDRYQELQRISNTRYIDKILKAYVIHNGGKEGTRDEIDEELCIMIPLLQVLSMEWWQSGFKLIEFLFDCFHKRLDKPFLMQIRGPWIASSEKKTPMDILNSVRDRLKNDYETSEESSYGLFLRLLGIFLKKNCSSPESKTWLQIRGRIFIKFSQKKLEVYSQCGLYNFISLYLTLAVTVDTCGIAAAMMKFFPSTDYKWNDDEGAKKFCLIWKSMLTILLLYKEQKLSFKSIASYFTEAAGVISCGKDEFSRTMMVWYVDVLRIILTQNTDFEYHEHGLLSGWLERYLTEIEPNRSAVLMNSILKIWEKCTSTENRHAIGHTLMRNAIRCHVVGRVRMMVNSHDDLNTNLYEVPTKLGAGCTIEACYDPHTFENHSPVKLFQHFTTSPILKDLRVTKLYLKLVLENQFAVEYLRKEIKDFDLLCIQLWIKCNILTKEQNEQDHFLKNYIANLSAIKDMMSPDTDEFVQSNEPFTSFLAIISKKRNTLKSEREQIIFDRQCRSFLVGSEKWIPQIITDDNKDSNLSNWTYRCMGLVIKHWAHILYSKDSSNMLKMLITRIALPPINQENLFYRMHLSKKIFSMIILSFENLNATTDVSLQNLIRELFERYLPLLVTQAADNEQSFKIADTLSKCFFAKPDFTKLIFSILGRSLITIPQDQTTHAVCYLVMLLLIHLIKAGKKYSMELVNSIVCECGENIVKCYCLLHDLHPHKKHTMDFLREITINIYYKENLQIREKLKTVMWNELKKRTISHPTATFDLLHFIFKINKELFKFLYTHMEAFVSTCEKQHIPNAATLRFLFNSMKKT